VRIHSQYRGLEELYERFQKNGFEVLGFPCNQFGSQEPGSESDIRSFCDLQFGVRFPLFSKIDVNGAGTHPLYEFLKKTRPGFLGTKRIKWNFTKFLIDRQGRPIKRYSPQTVPDGNRKRRSGRSSADRSALRVHLKRRALHNPQNDCENRLLLRAGIARDRADQRQVLVGRASAHPISEQLLRERLDELVGVRADGVAQIRGAVNFRSVEQFGGWINRGPANLRAPLTA
jgi:glutathione peroxidase